jgi:hypothetical protein
MANKRVFVAFASEDIRMRDLLKGQSLNTSSGFEYVDMSVKQPYDSAWKTRTRTRIKGSDGVIALLSKNTKNADGQLWEIQCALDEGKPLMGIYAYNDDRSVPPGFPAGKVRDWTKPNLAAFIDSL